MVSLLNVYEISRNLVMLLCYNLQIVCQLAERKRKELRKVYPGLTCFRDGVRQIPIESIPGVLESGWKPTPEK